MLAARDGLGSVEVISASNDNLLDVAHSYLVVNGFVFNGNLAPEHRVLIRDSGDFLFFAGNEVVHSGKDCINMAGPDGVRIERTVLHDCRPS